GVELKSVAGSVFFSSDTANPDTSTHFYCDIEMYTTVMLRPDPQRFMLQFVSWEVASKQNKWQGLKISRWQSKQDYELFRDAQRELDAVRRAAMYIELNDMVVGDHYILPEVYRPKVIALKNGLTAHLSGWDNDLWQLANWYRET